ncbi:MAG TPA: hypothetical protein VHM25_22755 [Polyangiaceae bacterium]|nr:hypothetical protein [Polyangiaceae bacterium]
MGTAEAVTVPYGSVSRANSRESLTLRYAPFLTLTTANGEGDRQLLVLHTAQLTWQLQMRRTTFRVSQFADYGTRNFIVDAFGDRGIANTPAGTPTPPAVPGGPAGGTGNPGTGNPGTGNPNVGNPATGNNGAANRPTVAAQAGTFRYGDLITQAGFNHNLSKRASTGAYVRYMVSGGMDEPSREAYPVIYNPSFGGFYNYNITPRSGVFGTTTGSYSTSSFGNQTYNADLSVGYRYRFTKSFGLAASLGLGYARIIYPDGSVLEYFYLTAGAGAGLGVNFEYRTKLGGGILYLYARAGYAPTLDQVRAVLDQRISWAVGATWTRKRVALYAGVTSAFSVRVDQPGALDVIGGAAGGSYVLGSGFVFDAGVRALWQAFEGTTQIPPTALAFVGLSWGGSTSMGGRR